MLSQFRLSRGVLRGSRGGDIAAPPTTVGSIPDQVYTEGVAITPLDLSGYFSDADTYALAPSSAALSAGLTLSDEIISGTPTTAAAAVTIVIRASNDHGDADSGFQITINEASAEVFEEIITTDLNNIRTTDGHIIRARTSP